MRSGVATEHGFEFFVIEDLSIGEQSASTSSSISLEKDLRMLLGRLTELTHSDVGTTMDWIRWRRTWVYHADRLS
jgi:hypothetical protein